MPEKTDHKRSGARPANGLDRTLFISYRISDTGPTATWLARELMEAYGREYVFLDHERLEGGAAWPERLEREAQRASVMLVLIGEGWLRAHDPETFVRRLDQENDWVRKEIEIALAADSLIVPLLVEGAKALSRQAFATVPSLAPLADRQTLALRRNDLASDLKRLQELLAASGFNRDIAPVLPSPPTPAEPLIPKEIYENDSRVFQRLLGNLRERDFLSFLDDLRSGASATPHGLNAAIDFARDLRSPSNALTLSPLSELRVNLYRKLDTLLRNFIGGNTILLAEQANDIFEAYRLLLEEAAVMGLAIR